MHLISAVDEQGKRSIFVLLLRKLQSVGIGVLAAVATVVVADHFRQQSSSSAPATAASGASQRLVRTVVVEGSGLDRITELERQLRELQEARAASTANPPGDDAPSRAELLLKREEAYAQFEQEHERDIPDPEWAPRAERQLTSGLSTLGEELGFKVGPTDCKTTTCRATVTWGDYTSARVASAKLVERFYPGLNCAQRIRMKAPEDQRAPYSAQLYLDCTDQRAGLVDEPSTHDN